MLPGIFMITFEAFNLSHTKCWPFLLTKVLKEGGDDMPPQQQKTHGINFLIGGQPSFYAENIPFSS